MQHRAAAAQDAEDARREIDAREAPPPAGGAAGAGAGEAERDAAVGEELEQAADAALLARVAGGDLAGFDQLVDRYKRRLFRHIRRRIADPHRAEDLTQEAFLRLFRAARAGAYSGRARVVTWLFAIAGNVVTDHLRFEGRRLTIPLGGVDPPERPDAGPAAAAAAREGESHMRKILDDLPEAQREVVELHVLDGLSFSDIAELTGCPIPTVKSRLVYALRKLKRSLDEARRTQR